MWHCCFFIWGKCCLDLSVFVAIYLASRIMMRSSKVLNYLICSPVWVLRVCPTFLELGFLCSDFHFLLSWSCFGDENWVCVDKWSEAEERQFFSWRVGSFACEFLSCWKFNRGCWFLKLICVNIDCVHHQRTRIEAWEQSTEIVRYWKNRRSD